MMILGGWLVIDNLGLITLEKQFSMDDSQCFRFRYMRTLIVFTTWTFVVSIGHLYYMKPLVAPATSDLLPQLVALATWVAVSTTKEIGYVRSGLPQLVTFTTCNFWLLQLRGTHGRFNYIGAIISNLCCSVERLCYEIFIASTMWNLSHLSWLLPITLNTTFTLKYQ